MESLYITKSGKLARRQNTIWLQTKNGERYFYPVKNVEDIHVFSKIELNSSFLEFMSKEKIVVHFYNYFGHYTGSYYPKEYLVSGFLLSKQACYYQDISLRMPIAKAIVSGAMNVMAFVVKDRARRLSSFDSTVLENVDIYKQQVWQTENIDELMGIEGKFRNMYLKDIDKLIKADEMKIGIRTRRPPLSKGNALMSFLNSLVYSSVLTQIYHTHLDPRIGYLHETGWRRFALSLDIAEIFKPLIADRLLLTLINRGHIASKHFSDKSGMVLLNETGKKIVLREYDKFIRGTVYHPRIERQISWKRLMRMEVFRIEKHIMEDQEYTPFVFPLK